MNWESFAVAAISLYGLWLQSSGKRAGWLWGMAAQFVWVAYIISIKQWGLLFTPPVYFVIYLRGWRKYVHRADVRRVSAPQYRRPLSSVR